MVILFLLFSDCNANWADSFGDNCQKYADKDWCSPTGGYGSEWRAGWGTIENYAVDGKSAFVCPQCGCGNTEKTGDIILIKYGIIQSTLYKIIINNDKNF